MASLSQNFEENPRHVPWKNKTQSLKKNAHDRPVSECMKPRLFTTTLTYLNSRKNIITPLDNSQESQQPEKAILRKCRRSDPICCVAVMKLVCYIFAHTCTERTALARAIYVSR